MMKHSSPAAEAAEPAPFFGRLAGTVVRTQDIESPIDVPWSTSPSDPVFPDDQNADAG